MILNPVTVLWTRIENGKRGLLGGADLVGISGALGSVGGLRESANFQKFVPIVVNGFRDVAHCEDTLLHSPVQSGINDASDRSLVVFDARNLR